MVLCEPFWELVQFLPTISLVGIHCHICFQPGMSFIPLLNKSIWRCHNNDIISTFDMADGPNGCFDNGHEGVVGREGTPIGVLSPFADRPIVK